jgi:AraC-like DNA-binding protein
LEEILQKKLANEYVHIMNLAIADLILLLAAAQGLFLAVLIFHKHGKLFANRFLGAMIFIYSAVLVHLFLDELGYSIAFPHFPLLIIGAGFLIPPLHYLYAKYLVRNAMVMKKKDWLHFLPFLVYECYRLPTFFQADEELVALFANAETKGLPLDFVLFNWAIFLQASAYMLFTLLLLNRHARYIKEVFSNLEKVRLDWLRNITYFAMGFIIVFGIENALLLFGVNLSNYFNLSSILTAVYVYALGYLGLFKSEVFAAPAIADWLNQLPALGFQNKQAEETPGPRPPKYEKSGLSTESAKKHLQQLLELIKSKEPYTKSELTLNQLAEMLDISPHNLSEVINTQLHQNFFDFINEYRLEKVKKDLADPQKQNLKVLAIAFEAGFNSKSSFNALFKKHTNLTPSEYRRQMMRELTHG